MFKVELMAKSIESLPFEVSNLLAAEVNACLSLIDTFMVLVAALSSTVRNCAIKVMERSLAESLNNEGASINRIAVSKISEIILDILKVVTQRLDSNSLDSSDIPTSIDIDHQMENNSTIVTDTHVNSILPVDSKSFLLPIVIGSNGVIDFLSPEKRIYALNTLRLDQIRLTIFEACSAVLCSLDTTEILEKIFDQPESCSVQYENVCDEYIAKNLQNNESNVQITTSTSVEQPLPIMTSRIKTLCRVIYDDPFRRLNQVTIACGENESSVETDNMTVAEKYALGLDSECVTIVFCCLRLYAMAMSEFLKQLCPEIYLRKKLLPNSNFG